MREAGRERNIAKTLVFFLEDINISRKSRGKNVKILMNNLDCS